MIMVRFLLGELGISLQKGNSDISEKKNNQYVEKLKLSDVVCDSNYQNVLAVLKAANKAIAHMEDIDVNHAIETNPDDKILFNAISFTELMCIEKMYKYNSYKYK